VSEHPALPPRTPQVHDFPDKGPNSLAAFDQRAWARIIDELIVGIPLVLTLFLWFAATVSLATPPPDSTSVPAPRWLFFPVIAVGVAYEVIAVSWRGQTVGKWVLGIRVGRFTDGQNPTLSQSALRCLLPTVAAVVVLSLFSVWAVGAFLVFATVYYNPLRRGLHDQAGGTIVVRVR
jgi:uncharacterized RDD family membrane protein YckC